MPMVARYEDHRPPDLEELVRASGFEDIDFVARTRREWDEGVNRFDRPGEAFFVAVETPEIIGMCGLNIDPYLGDPEVGRLRHLYVHPLHRRIGTGRALVESCLEVAAGRFRRIRLRTGDPGADAFYRALGFRRCTEPAASHTMLLE